jgi:hypothetical protein
VADLVRVVVRVGASGVVFHRNHGKRQRGFINNDCSERHRSCLEQARVNDLLNPRRPKMRSYTGPRCEKALEVCLWSC